VVELWLTFVFRDLLYFAGILVTMRCVWCIVVGPAHVPLFIPADLPVAGDAIVVNYCSVNLVLPATAVTETEYS
jgi:hypothetical protein